MPTDWLCSEIGDLIDLLTGFPFPSSGYSTSGTRLLRGSNVKRGETDWSDDICAFWPKVTGDIVRYLLKEGDIVVAMDGSLVGKSFASLAIDDLPALLLQRVARIRSSKISQSYLSAWVCSARFTDHCDSVKTTTAIPHISPDDIRSFKIGIPPTVAEQNAIGAALVSSDSLIESLEQLLAKKRQIKQGAMQKLLTGQRRLPGFGGEWVSYAMGQLARITMGRTPSRIQSKYWGHGYKWLSISDLKGRTVADSKEEITAAAASDMEVIPAGTLLMSFKLTLGRLCFAGTDLFTNEAICAFRDLKANPELVYYALQRVDFSLVGKQAVKGYTLNKESLAAVSVLLPSDKNEQTAIATILSDMDTEITALEARLTKARHLKQGMAQALLTGRIRLQLPDAG